jgi:DMSO/TMAO reductase YedYZ molybdopterin-dependent catalytic subunit
LDIVPIDGHMTRRRFLREAAGGAAAWMAVPLGAAKGGHSLTNHAGQPSSDLTGGRLVATLRLDLPAAARVPLETRVGAGLDGRLFTDLSRLMPATLVTPNDSFFIRTASPRQLPPANQWSISVGGLVRNPVKLTLGALEPDVRPAGVHLLECSGNAPPTFGLMSAAQWDGVPLAAILDRGARLDGATHAIVSGLDDVDSLSSTSLPGASWVFALEDLERAGAFLATRMNGQALARDHGGPARLVVPGWYGCVCIKWVTEIALLNGEAAATSQMREFAARTHQNGVPARAADFAAATMDLAAMPVRVEKWSVDGRVVYRVVGILWGGSKPSNDLMIRFKSNQPFVAVSDCPMPASTATWSLWSHVWRPEAPGRYQIALRLNDRAVRTRRLDLYFYIREISIDDV